MKRNYGQCSSHKCSEPGTHVARHGVYRGLSLCDRCHEGPRSDEVGVVKMKLAEVAEVEGEGQ